jgi:hypothetical protein
MLAGHPSGLAVCLRSLRKSALCHKGPDSSHALKLSVVYAAKYATLAKAYSRVFEYIEVELMNADRKRELVSMMALDQRTLSELAHRGEIGPHQPYHPVLREIHESNARALAEIIEEIGWPTISKVGAQGAEAAWNIVQHSVSDTGFMSDCAELLEVAVSSQDAEGWQLAFLKDRLQTMSGEEQVYGTQFDQDAEGWPTPFPIRDPDGVNERRLALGLNSIEERTAELRLRETARQAAVSRANEEEGGGGWPDADL